jgi:hypothetical protein
MKQVLQLLMMPFLTKLVIFFQSMKTHYISRSSLVTWNHCKHLTLRIFLIELFYHCVSCAVYSWKNIHKFSTMSLLFLETVSHRALGVSHTLKRNWSLGNNLQHFFLNIFPLPPLNYLFFSFFSSMT